jgi:hypothetical protein
VVECHLRERETEEHREAGKGRREGEKEGGGEEGRKERKKKKNKKDSGCLSCLGSDWNPNYTMLSLTSV